MRKAVLIPLCALPLLASCSGTPKAPEVTVAVRAGPGTRVPMAWIESFVEKERGVQITFERGRRPWFARTHLLPSDNPSSLFRAIAVAKKSTATKPQSN